MTSKPKLNFMIIGAQKGGTSALSHFLSQHDDICFSSVKESHVFDSIDYSSEWSTEEIDQRYAGYFKHYSGEASRGEATPIYLFLPEIATELKHYNPNLRLIVILRDPVERAVSHYYMEKERGYEHYSLWLALLLEPIRQWRCHKPRADRSAVRINTYRQRGLYSRQLRNICQHFNSRQVLLLHSDDLLHNHRSVLQKVFEFLEVADDSTILPEEVFVGDSPKIPHRIVRFLLKLSFSLEYLRLRKILPFSIRSWVIG